MYKVIVAPVGFTKPYTIKHGITLCRSKPSFGVQRTTAITWPLYIFHLPPPNEYKKGSLDALTTASFFCEEHGSVPLGGRNTIAK